MQLNIVTKRMSAFILKSQQEVLAHFSLMMFNDLKLDFKCLL